MIDFEKSIRDEMSFIEDARLSFSAEELQKNHSKFVRKRNHCKQISAMLIILIAIITVPLGVQASMLIYGKVVPTQSGFDMMNIGVGDEKSSVSDSYSYYDNWEDVKESSEWYYYWQPDNIKDVKDTHITISIEQGIGREIVTYNYADDSSASIIINDMEEAGSYVSGLDYEKSVVKNEEYVTNDGAPFIIQTLKQGLLGQKSYSGIYGEGDMSVCIHVDGFSTDELKNMLESVHVSDIPRVTSMQTDNAAIETTDDIIEEPMCSGDEIYNTESILVGNKSVYIQTDLVYEESDDHTSASCYGDVYDKNGTYYGSIASQGTAYPILYDKETETICVWSDHGATSYTIDNGHLKMAKSAHIYYLEDDIMQFIYTNQPGEQTIITDEDEFYKYADEIYKGQVLDFK